MKRWLLMLVFWLAGCAQQPAVPPAPCVPTQPVAPAVERHLQARDWSDLPGWGTDNLLAIWPAWLRECDVMGHKPAWQTACRAARQLQPDNSSQIQEYFQHWFVVWQSLAADGNAAGLITGYYTPLLQGRLTRQPGFTVPLYAPPPDLLTIDLASIYPALKGMRLRGRLQGNQVVPYYDRAAIDGESHPLAGHELVWVDDAVDAFFLQIQGSGRIALPDGRELTIGYADQNGYPYQAIGRVLVEQGALKPDQLSMQAIRDWGRAHPSRLPELLNHNPSYVFFRWLPARQPLGALGLPVVAQRSLAIDPRAMPLGAPVWISTTSPETGTPLQQLMLAHDTGGAIRGNVRADFYFGIGNEAGEQAGRMKAQGSLWVLLPKGDTRDAGSQPTQ